LNMEYKIEQRGYIGKITPIPNGKLKRVLMNNLSYKNPFYPGMPEWAKVTKLYKEKKGEFRWGLIHRIKKIFDKWESLTGEEYEIFKSYIYDNDNFRGIVDEALYYYQRHAVNTFFKYNLGIFQLPCGSGKTRTAIEIVEKLSVQTLVVVHTNELKSQWESYNNKNIIVMTYQKLIADLSTLRMIAIYDFVIFDECHICKCKSIKKISSYLKASFILGLSASPTREDGHDMQIEEVCGQVIYSKNTRELIDEEFLCDAKVVLSKIHYKNNFFETYSQLYTDNIVNNIERNDKIINIVCENENKKILILVDRKEHGNTLCKNLELLNKKVIFFHSNIKKRKIEYEKIKNQEYDIIISTQIFDTGIDFPWLEILIMGCGGKSTVKIIQRIGRLLRKYKGKQIAYIYDFNDSAKMLNKHTKRRVEYYKETGFEIVERNN